jgi:(1->4)-alpha-D-glucan 1-alpha-D-glucosylmutase
MEKEQILAPRIPVATYRVQFSGDFTFLRAREIISYLDELGISDVYASPYLKAKKGSLHGYDIVDHTSLNPEVGSEEDYDAFVQALSEHGMGQLLDIVPNHMCITDPDNAWWMDVLENGPSSVYSNFFDIDWEPAKGELRNKVLLPILGDQYGKVLEEQELRLSFEQGAFFIHYFEQKLPIRPQTFIVVLEYRLEEFRALLQAEDPHLIELLSIITALKHLPGYVETESQKISERTREKEVVKKRLWNLYNESPEIMEFVDENVRRFNGEKGDPGSFDLLDGLLNVQVYRLSFWRVATEEINYRRFFDINSLGSIRVEDPAVFQETHRLIMKFVREGKITGLRVDHPDGLYDPSAYFRQLQKNCFFQLRAGYLDRLKEEVSPVYEIPNEDSEILVQYKAILSSNPEYKSFYIVGEKILIKGERMPEEWPIFSTTGYVFLNSLNGIFVDMRNAKAFSDLYQRFIKARVNYQDIVYEKKKLIMEVAMSSEVNTLGHYLNRLSENDRHTRDFTLNSLIDAVVEVVAFFPVYRTYVNRDGVNDRDRQYIELAVSKARRRNASTSALIFLFVQDVLLLRFPENLKEKNREEWLDFAMRFQQITGPVMAKGVEDTVFYVYNRLVSLNEVGGMPERFGTPLETFHGQNIERVKHWPHALVATSTHDTKRSEDVRARINVLSELPEEWRRRIIYWGRINKRKKVIVDGEMVPDRNEEYLLYQTLVGAWPVESMDGAAYDVFRKRIRDYMTKAVREAKMNTSWINPNMIYEDALMIFIDRILNRDIPNHFLKDFEPFQKEISRCGMFNSLSQTLLKITCPGVPDFYQGSELWDFSLVDPDNRRPIDYEMRSALLNEIKQTEAGKGQLDLSCDLTTNMENGKIKLYLTWKALSFRQDNRDIFEKGEYIPLDAGGQRVENVCSFARRIMSKTIVVVVPRFLASLMRGHQGLPFGSESCKDTYVAMPPAEAGAEYRNILTGETVEIKPYQGAHVLFLSEVFAHFPVALLERISQ